MGDVFSHRAFSNFKLEYIMPTSGKHLLSFGDILIRIAACQRPGNRHCRAHFATKQLGNRNTKTTPKTIPKRRFHRAPRNRVPPHDLLHQVRCCIHVVALIPSRVGAM